MARGLEAPVSKSRNDQRRPVRMRPPMRLGGSLEGTTPPGNFLAISPGPYFLRRGLRGRRIDMLVPGREHDDLGLVRLERQFDPGTGGRLLDDPQRPAHAGPCIPQLDRSRGAELDDRARRGIHDEVDVSWPCFAMQRAHRSVDAGHVLHKGTADGFDRRAAP